ncbi:hypothetical protein GDO81_000699 [Engystomops pustulosus]|uniref:Uncharacterized protein n=1 Tax=Engystomops pustulosus TaxID=76066 RepID=A0AAV7D8E4_ENGPU|nr:hypothetical protein GDO81_000699 [Engystomops pustulosus]
MSLWKPTENFVNLPVGGNELTVLWLLRISNVLLVIRLNNRYITIIVSQQWFHTAIFLVSLSRSCVMKITVFLQKPMQDISR